MSETDVKGHKFMPENISVHRSFSLESCQQHQTTIEICEHFCYYKRKHLTTRKQSNKSTKFSDLSVELTSLAKQ